MEACISLHAGSICECALQYCRPDVHWKYTGYWTGGPGRGRGMRAHCDLDLFFCQLGGSGGSASHEYPDGAEAYAGGLPDCGKLFCAAFEHGLFDYVSRVPAEGQAPCLVWGQSGDFSLCGYLSVLVSARNRVRPAGYGDESVYYLPGLCKDRDAVGGSGGSVQYRSGSGVYFCFGYGSEGSGHCHRDFPDGFLCLCFGLPFQQKTCGADYVRLLPQEGDGSGAGGLPS